eukprot:10300458-Lingulodinium_polyedra.AAC.1
MSASSPRRTRRRRPGSRTRRRTWHISRQEGRQHRVYDSDDSMQLSERDGQVETETDQGPRAASNGPAQGFRE